MRIQEKQTGYFLVDHICVKCFVIEILRYYSITQDRILVCAFITIIVFYILKIIVFYTLIIVFKYGQIIST